MRKLSKEEFTARILNEQAERKAKAEAEKSLQEWKNRQDILSYIQGQKERRRKRLHRR